MVPCVQILFCECESRDSCQSVLLNFLSKRNRSTTSRFFSIVAKSGSLRFDYRRQRLKDFAASGVRWVKLALRRVELLDVGATDAPGNGSGQVLVWSRSAQFRTTSENINPLACFEPYDKDANCLRL